MSLSLAAAMALDAFVGEPRVVWTRIPHPVVLMGRAVSAAEARLNRGPRRRAKGIVAMAVLASGAAGLGAALSALPGGAVAAILAAAILLAQRSLADHVRAVASGLRTGLPSGRAAVARIVGRDTEGMDAPEIARAAIESAAENLSDGVIAPAFWFLLAGLPGMLVYKMVNTADSMVGYRTDRYAAFGWAAARADDALNWVPARLTAGLIGLAFGIVRGWGRIAREAGQHRSPNAGWPEAALAPALGIALSGPRSYDGVRQEHPWVNGDGRREIGPVDIDRAVAALWRVWAVALVLVSTAGLAPLLLGGHHP